MEGIKIIIGRKTKKFLQYYGKNYVNEHYKKGQTKLDEKIEYNNFRIGDKVKFKRQSPNYIMVITRFIYEDYVSLRLPDNRKGFSAYCNLSSLVKVDENGV